MPCVAAISLVRRLRAIVNGERGTASSEWCVFDATERRREPDTIAGEVANEPPCSSTTFVINASHPPHESESGFFTRALGKRGEADQIGKEDRYLRRSPSSTAVSVAIFCPGVQPKTTQLSPYPVA